MLAKLFSAASVFAAALTIPALAAPPTPADGFIVVNADGSVARASKGYGAVKYDVGHYEISYPTSLHNCADSITEGTSDSTTPPEGFATVVGRDENPQVLEIQTFDSTGHAADAGFHLILRC